MLNKTFEKIKRYMDLSKVSVFVGAGVSALSKYPSWNALVKTMSDEIGYTKEDEEKNFSSEELLKIPQMYYNTFKERRYLEKIKTEFSGNYETNEIHDLIFSLKPKNILTTNYDTLLERTSVKFGRNYSVINSDRAVSSGVSNQYLIKLHGDFSANFVLKEQDYLDYETNYMLIDNLVKSIFATTLVIFVGYGLNDYNIKLILNWVKNVQADTFICPIFIHTGKKLSKLDKKYQKYRGLEVIDANDFGKFADDDYQGKYKKVLREILNYNSKAHCNSKINIVEKLNDKVTGIENIHYFRRRDFNSIFANEYYLDNWGSIKSLFDSLLTDEERKNFVNQCIIGKNSSLNCFISHCELELSEGEWKKRENDITNNISFLSDFEEMEEYCGKDYAESYEKYKKAYYLAQLSRYRESYILFTELVYILKKNEEWDLYYLSQINRWYLYQIILQLVEQTSGKMSFFTLGRTVEIYEREFIRRLNYEMGNFDLEQQFDYLPMNFRGKFVFLENLCRKNPYSDRYLLLMENKGKIQHDLASKTSYAMGISKADTIKREALEEIKFTYENMILYTGFKEYKTYIKNAIMSWLEYYVKECEQQKKEQRPRNNCYYKLTFTDIIILSKTCENDDIDYLKRIHAFKILVLSKADVKLLTNYLIRQLNAYKNLLVTDGAIGGEKIFLLMGQSFEIKRLLQMCAYYIAEDDMIFRIFDLMREILNYYIILPEIVNIMLSYIALAKIDEDRLISYVEKWLIDMGNKQCEHFNKVMELLIDCKKENSMPNISQMIMEDKFDERHLKAMNNIFLLLSTEAQTKINSILDFSVVNIYKRYKETKIQDAAIIYKACTVSFDQIIEKRKQEKIGLCISYGAYSDDDIIRTGIILLAQNRCTDKKFFEKYAGINDEFDYWFSERKFEDDRFNIHWIGYYSDDMLDIIKGNDKKKTQMLRILEMEDNFHKADNWLVRRMFYVYRYLVK